MPTCTELCAYNCNKTYGSITETCIKSCKCPCESSCRAVCNEYKLGEHCEFACGCLDKIDQKIYDEYPYPHIKRAPVTELLNASLVNPPAAACLNSCETAHQGNTEEIAKCMTGCAMTENSILLLGCVVQCSIGNWATAELFVKCIHGCVEANVTKAADTTNRQAISKQSMKCNTILCNVIVNLIFY